MFRAQVADFYRAKGYQVRENPRVRGQSESIYAVEMVAEGPLGALLISFGDAGGVDAIEVSRVRTLARDIGATPVIAAPEITPDLRRMAAQFAVVVVDQATLAQPDDVVARVPMSNADDLRRDLDAHPWPASGRARPDEPAAMDPQDVDVLLSQLGSSRPVEKPRGDGSGLWKRTVSRPPAARLPSPDAPMPATSVPPAAAAPVVTAPATPTRKFNWLTQGVADVAPAQSDGPTLEDMMPRPVATEPAPIEVDEALLTHEATIAARRSTILERVGDVAGDIRERAAETDRTALVKFGLFVLGGAVALFLVIRWLT
ncbi:MAG: hypothetical protein V4510_02890 [bacterium]